MVSFERYSSFKSKGEREIAEFLEREQIDYQYEYPLAVIDRDKTKIWYPDFRLPEYGIIMEYFGMNGNSSYDDQMAHKMKVYREAGVDGIYLTEQSMRGPWQEMIIERIEQNLEGKLRRIQRHRSKMNAKYSA